MATDTNKERRNPKKSRAADGFVMMAMAVVTLALCMGLVAQVGLSFWLAVTVSVAFYMGLLTLHVLVRRHDQLDELRTEVDRLAGEVARLSQTGGPVGRAPQAAMAPPAAGRAPHMEPQSTATSTRAPAMAPAPVPAPAPGADPLARIAAAMPPVVKAAAEIDKGTSAGPPRAPDSEANPLAIREIGDLDDGFSGAVREMRDPPAQQMQKIVRAPQMSGQRSPAAGGWGPELELPMGSHHSAHPQAPQMHLEMRAPAPPISGAVRARRNMAAEPPTATDSKDASTSAPLGAIESVSVGEKQRPTQAVGSGEGDAMPLDAVAAPKFEKPAKTSAGPIETERVADDLSAPSSGLPEAADWSYRPGNDAREPGFSPSETDVEMIQGLIRKLAEEVNSADAHKLSPSRSREALDEEALDRSVGALRQTARNMQEPQSAERGSRAAHRVATPGAVPAPERARDATIRQEPVKPSNIKPPTATAAARAALPTEPELKPEPELELDVEALMRRAKPIATMTSMPPPLPAAPNVMDTRDPQAQADEHAQDHVLDEIEASGYGDPESVAAAVAESAVDDIWNTVGDEELAGGSPSDDELDERVARIADALEAGRVDVFLEPILDLEKQQARHYEVSVLLRDESGAEISPDDPSEMERPSGILPLLDSVRLQRTALVARRLEERNKQGNVFSTFSGQSLTADDFLSAFAETYDAQVQFAGQLVLTFSQADARCFRMPHWTMINEMRDLGFGFALRAVTDLDMDFEMFAKAGFIFVKLDADVFLSGLPASDALVPAADLCKHLEGLGLTPVVEEINDQVKREQVAAYGVRLGQGHLFGGPRQVKTPHSSGSHPAAA